VPAREVGGGEGLRTLIVAPVARGSGETVTALHVAERLIQEGNTVGFLASEFAHHLIGPRFDSYAWSLGPRGVENKRSWKRALAEFQPDVVLFADYPLMFFPSGCVPLALEDGWVEQLEEIDTTLVTMDHFGFCQREGGFFMGPAHLGFFAHYAIPALPSRMQVMLPCPMHEPGFVCGRRGEPFRYWDVPLSLAGGERELLRHQHGYAPDDVVVFHSVPAWAITGAEQLGVRLYSHLPELFEEYFGSAERPVTVISVNNGCLLEAAPGSSVRMTNLGALPVAQFERLLFSADLVITENKLSISMGKAVCALQPCAALTNSARLIELWDRMSGRVRDVVLAMERGRLGAVYPYAAFPSVTPEDLDTIGLYRDNRLRASFREIEVFGGSPTRAALQALLFDPNERAALRRSQKEYVMAVQGLPDGAELLRRFSTGDITPR
jgi:hypothetical protein